MKIVKKITNSFIKIAILRKRLKHWWTLIKLYNLYK